MSRSILDPAIEPYSIAATRDASWYDRPDVHSAKKIHVWGEDEMSACGRSILTETSTFALADVPERRRCQRSGCRERWPASPVSVAPAARLASTETIASRDSVRE